MLVERGYRAHGLTAGWLRSRLRNRSSLTIISDVEMPEQRGIDLVSALQRIPSSPPVLLMTAFGTIDLQCKRCEPGPAIFDQAVRDRGAV